MRPDKQLSAPARPDGRRRARSPTATSWWTRRRLPGRGSSGRRCSFTARPTATPSPAASPMAVAVATLYSNATTATANPARDPARGGGRRRARPPPSRSTSPARSSTRARATPPGPVTSATARPSCAPTTCSSGRRPGTRRPDWVDLAKVAIPQADELQRLLANLILTHERRPQAAAPVLVLPERQEGGRGHDLGQPRGQRHQRRRPLPGRGGGEPGGLLGRGLGVRPLLGVRVHGLASRRRHGAVSGRARASRSRCT